LTVDPARREAAKGTRNFTGERVPQIIEAANKD